jgi:hypothetical protein
VEINVTFSGQDAEPISTKELDTIIKMFDGGIPEIHQLSHNCENNQLLKTFGVVDVGAANDSYFGLPVYKKGWIPLGEIWLQDKDGHVIGKFSIDGN